ncbi:hypothetical protein CH35J_007121 [Colletotrichum higginsianum]|uniref:Uncharacterized protein n=1 Tax=Colletotrichum higginsianum TaxID=80884 RepID=A0A4V4NBY7_9PEZI|nr:hypothetical protein CH35J_007121 [Colletotrichum higginsianum]
MAAEAPECFPGPTAATPATPATPVKTAAAAEAPGCFPGPTAAVGPLPCRSNPGDRGLIWRQHVSSNHYIVDDYSDHYAGNCRDVASVDHNSNSYGFAFKSSNEEKKKGEGRKIVILVWDSRLEEKTFRRLGLDYFYQPNAEVWDLQLHPAWRYCLGADRNHRRGSSACKMLGVAYETAWGESLAHCAGNIAAFDVQIMLALGTATTEQKELVKASRPLPTLPQSWVDYTLAQVNKPWLLRRMEAGEE